MSGHELRLRKEIFSAAIEMSDCEISLCLLRGTEEFPWLECIIVEIVATSEVLIYDRYMVVNDCMVKMADEIPWW